MKLISALVLFAVSSLPAAEPIRSAPSALAAAHLCAAGIRQLGKPGGDTQRVFTECLSGYVRIDSQTLSGEELAVEYLAAIFDELGIPFRTFTTKGQGDDRASHPNLIATLTPSNALLADRGREAFDWSLPPQRGSIVLMNHTDVVPVVPAQWERADLPFSGEVAAAKDGEKFLWGRGALDMKGIGMLQLFTLAQLKAQGATLDKDIHFLAVADEEKLSSGAIGAIAEIHPGGQLAALQTALVVLGEGGMGIKGAIGGKTTLHLLNNEEKGGAWLRLSAQSAEGLFKALDKLRLLGDGGGFWFAKKWGCRVENAVTPEAQVNVVTSQVTIELSCARNPAAAEMEKAFRSVAPALQVKVSLDGRRYRVALATPSAAHGAFARGATLLQSMASGLEKIGVIHRGSYAKPSFYRYQKTAATANLLDTIGANETFGELFGTNTYPLPSLGSLGTYFPERWLGMLGKQLYTEGLFRTTCAWSALERKGDRFEALVDCRLLRPAKAREFLTAVEHRVAPVHVAPISLWDFSQSPADYWAYQAIRRELESEKTAVQYVGASQWLAPNGSDNNYFRSPRAEHGHVFKGVPAYGFFPIVVPTALIATQHGSNERFPLAEMVPGVRRYLQAVRRLAGGL